MIRVEPAWIRKNPDSRRSDSLLLQTCFGPRTIEPDSIGSNSQNRQPLRFVFLHFALEGDSARTIFLIAELGSSGGRSANDGSDSEPKGEQLITLAGMQQTISEAGGMQRRPEAIARSRKVQPRRAGVESGIDATEKNLEVRRDQIRDNATVCVLQVFRSRSPKLYRGRHTEEFEC